MTFEMIKRNYDRGLWNLEMVRLALTKGIITEAEFQEITKQA